MYLWNVKALATDLREKKISQREKLYYFLATVFFSSLTDFSGDIFPHTRSLEALGVGFFINIIGIVFCYMANNEGDNEEFIDRLVCLSVPIGIRTLVVTIIVALAAAFFAPMISFPKHHFFGLLADLVFIFFFWQCYINISYIAKNR